MLVDMFFMIMFWRNIFEQYFLYIFWSQLTMNLRLCYLVYLYFLASEFTRTDQKIIETWRKHLTMFLSLYDV